MAYIVSESLTDIHAPRSTSELKSSYVLHQVFFLDESRHPSICIMLAHLSGRSMKSILSRSKRKN